jgi:hypothetical protein
MIIRHQLSKGSIKNQILITFDYTYEQWILTNLVAH